MYFPYYLWFINLFSFAHYNSNLCDKSIKLWSIRYISYEDVINDALKV